MKSRQREKLFRSSTIHAGGSVLTLVLLMLGNHFLVLTFFVCVVYAVVPFSLWQKHHSTGWRAAILLTCSVGFGIIGSGLIKEWIDLKNADPFEVYLAGFASLRLAFLTGVIFLPLACVGSMHSLITAIRARRIRARM